MGFFDRFTGKKPAPQPAPDTSRPAPEAPAAAPGDGAVASTGGGVKVRLGSAREKLEVKDLAGALAIYEEVLATAGDRADVLVTISGDLGTHGHVAEIIELIAPRYDAERHGPATGLNLLQAYLAVRNADAAQHVLDILFALKRPELEDRLHGFSNAIAELLAAPHPTSDGENGAPPAVPKIGLITISRPIWAYGLEAMTDRILPAKEGRVRRIAFAQLALPGYPEIDAAITRPEDELARLSRAVPLWFAETFYASANYAPIAAIGIVTPPGQTARYMIFGAEWTTDNLRQLVDTHQGSLDYIFTGALRAVDADYELVLRVYEVKSFRERKKFQVRWTPATANEELARLHGELRRFMEWTPANGPRAYEPPASPRAWLETLGAAVGLFVVEKSILPAELLPPIATDLERAAAAAAGGETASLLYLTMAARAAKLGVAPPTGVTLAQSPVVDEAARTLGL